MKINNRFKSGFYIKTQFEHKMEMYGLKNNYVYL